MQFIAWPNWLGPTKFIEAGTHNATRRLQLAFHEEAHGKGSRVPAARRQPAEDRVLRYVVVEMERLWIELGGKTLYPLLFHYESPRAEPLAN
jgi:hypothetical protein